MNTNTQDVPGLPPVVYRPLTPLPVIVEERLDHLAWLGRSERHRETVAFLLRKFARAHPGPIGELTAPHVRAFLTGLGPRAPRTLNNYLVTLRGLARFAKRRRYLPPWWDELDQLDRFTVTPEPVRIYSAAELAGILRACPATIRAGVVLIAFCGLRTCEVLRVPWSAVDLERRIVFIEAAKAKTRARRICPIPENAAAWLEELRPDTNGIVIPLTPALSPSAGAREKQADGAREKSIYGGTRKTFNELLRRGAKRAGVSLHHNGLRHSFVSHRLAVVKSAEAVALEAGNTAQMVFAHYREIVTADQAADYWALRPPARVLQLEFSPALLAA